MAHLLEIPDLVRKKHETEKQLVIEEPYLLIVITGGPIAYTNPDGVHVVPLACLKTDKEKRKKSLSHLRRHMPKIVAYALEVFPFGKTTLMVA